MHKFYDCMDGVGKVKYLVNHHDGEKKHADGSPFIDVKTFTNKRKRDKFVTSLKKQDYKPLGMH